MRKLLAVALVALVAATLPAAAQAKLTLEFDRASAAPGERVTLSFGSYFSSPNRTVHVYLVRAPILGNVIRPALGGGVSRPGPPPRLAGVTKVGRTTSASGRLAFRVPAVAAGRYAAVIWCSNCRERSLLAVFQGGIPDDAVVRPARALLRVVRA